VESAEGLINFRDICCTLQEGLAKSNTSLAAVIFGSDDFCASIGMSGSVYSRAVQQEALGLDVASSLHLCGIKLKLFSHIHALEWQTNF